MSSFRLWKKSSRNLGDKCQKRDRGHIRLRQVIARMRNSEARYLEARGGSNSRECWLLLVREGALMYGFASILRAS